MAPPWRAPFDRVERPVAKASESWLNSNAFMDGFSIAWRLQRRVNTQLRRGAGLWLGALDLSSRGDIDRLSNQIARLERQVRELRTELEQSATTKPPGRQTGQNGNAPRRRPAGGRR
jgi:hypothetical protein